MSARRSRYCAQAGADSSGYKWDALLVSPSVALPAGASATLFYENDNKVIDCGIDEMCKGTVESGRIIAFLHSGMIQYRLLVTFAVMVLLSLYFVF